MFETSTLVAYLAAVAAVVLAPGPGQALVLARALGGGWRAGILTSLGLNVGTLVHTGAAALGLSAILATSAPAFAVVKYAGAAYLVVLGMRALRDDGVHAAAPPPGRASFRQAIWVGVLNPKVALFFLAFLPQFVDPRRGSALLQFLVLGAVFAAAGILWDCVLAAAAGRLSAALTGRPGLARWRQRLLGGTLLGLGVRLAMADRR